MTAAVVDTNVAVVANGKADHAPPLCQIACIERLQLLISDGTLLLDSLGHILGEYLGHLPSGSPIGVGDQFFVWVVTNQTNTSRCRMVEIAPDEVRGYVEFPDDPELAAFDWDDRKFASVALGSTEECEILNASDTDWAIHRRALESHGISISFLCPCLMP